MPDRLVKKGRLARSGLYQYSEREIPNLGLPLPPPSSIGKKSFYSIYRPASVLAKAVRDGLFVRLPMTKGHPSEWVDRSNFKEYVIGYTGDTATIEYLSDIDEVAVCGSMALAADEAITDYEKGITDLSPGYSATFIWRKGKTSYGKSYDAVMTEINETNHLALVPKGRGGATAAILDAEGTLKVRDIASRIWYRAKKHLLVKDEMFEAPVSEASGFRSGLAHLIEARAALSEGELSKKVDEMKSLVRDLPDNTEKGLLLRYMEDFKLMKESKNDVLSETSDIASKLFDKLDKHALSEGGSEGEMKDCADCHGTGKIGSMDCSSCGGKGKVGDDPAGTERAAGDPPLDKAKDEPGGWIDPDGPIGKKQPEINPDPDKHDHPGEGPNMEKIDGKGKTIDEPDPAVPAQVPPAPPKQAPSPSPAGVPAAPAGAPQAGTPPAAPAAPGAAPAAAPAQGGPQFWMTKLAELLKGMMADPQIQQMMAPAPAAAAPGLPGAAPPAAAPAAAPAAPAPAAPAPAAPAAAAPVAAPAPSGPPEEKKEGPPPGGAKDSAPSLTALIGASKDSSPDGMTLDGAINFIHGRKG